MTDEPYVMPKPPAEFATPPRAPRDHTAADRVSAGYSRFYPVFAVGTLLFPFVPLFDTVHHGPDIDLTVSFGNLTQMASSGNGGPAQLALVLMGGLAFLLGWATFRARSTALPFWIALLSALLVAMVITRPGTGSRPPDLAGGGWAALVFGIALFLLSTAHTIQLDRANRRARTTVGTRSA